MEIERKTNIGGRRKRSKKSANKPLPPVVGGVFSLDQTYLDNEVAIKKIRAETPTSEPDKTIRAEHQSELAIREDFKKMFDEKRKLDLEGNVADNDLKRAQTALIDAETRLKRLERSKIYRDVLSQNVQWYLNQAYFAVALVVTTTLKTLNLPFKAMNSPVAIATVSGVGSTVSKTLGATLGEFIKVAMPYIVLGILICILLGVAFHYAGGRSHSSGNTGSAVWWNPLTWVDSLGQPAALFPSFSDIKLPTDSAWFKMPSAWKVMMRRLSGEPPAGLARKEEGGRCDEAMYHQYANSNGTKLCGRTSIDFPDDIVYTLSPDDIAAIVASQNVSQTLKACVSNPKVSQIFIPYKLNSTKDSFVPACGHARFNNGESAAKLFDASKETDSGDGGGMCACHRRWCGYF